MGPWRNMLSSVSFFRMAGTHIYMRRIAFSKLAPALRILTPQMLVDCWIPLYVAPVGQRTCVPSVGIILSANKQSYHQNLKRCFLRRWLACINQQITDSLRYFNKGFVGRLDITKFGHKTQEIVSLCQNRDTWVLELCLKGHGIVWVHGYWLLLLSLSPVRCMNQITSYINTLS